MATTSVDSNNKLIKFTGEIYREFVRENLFSPYMDTSLNAIIRVREDLVDGGEQMNIPLVTKLGSKGVGTGTLVGNEESIDNYGMRLWIDWARNAVTMKKSDRHKDSADVFGLVKPLLSDWGKERQRDDIIGAFMSLPSEAIPVGLGSAAGQTVNGIPYELATAAQRNTWNADNVDRVLYGNAIGNYNATHATALATVDTVNDTFIKSSVSLIKRMAENAVPKIRPFKTADGYEYYVCFAGSNTFRDLTASLETINKDARAREQKGMENNPIFQDGDLIYDGVIIRKVPEIGYFVTNIWTSLLTAGTTSNRVEPVFLCGQQAACLGWGQRPRPTERKEDDYGFITGAGVEMAYGVAKMFKKPTAGTKLVQWGMVTGFFAGTADG